MFKEPVRSTPFSTPYADRALGFTNNTAYGEDFSLTSTVRALLINRIPEGRTFNAWWSHYNMEKRTIDNATPRQIFSSIWNRTNTAFDTFNVVDIDTGNNDKVFSAIEEEMPDGYRKIEKITVFFRKSFKTLCYINENCRTVDLYIEKMDLRKLHFVQCSITAMLPWYFKPEEKLNEKELRLVKSLTADNVDEYLAAVSDIYDNCGVDFRKSGIERMLDGFMARVSKQKGVFLRNEVVRINNRIEDIHNELVRLMTTRDEKLASMFGYENMANKADSREIIDYFLGNQFVDLIETTEEGRMTFISRGYLTFWSEGYAKEMLDYNRSYIYSEGNSIRDYEDRKLLVKSIFFDRTIKVRMCAAYQFSVADHMVYGQRGYCYPGEYDTYMPNPHIDEYHCLGGNEAAICELLEAGEYIGAIDQCIMSSRSMTMSDGAVTSKFFRRLFTEVDKKYLEAPDGTLMSVKEAIAWLKEQNKEE